MSKYTKLVALFVIGIVPFELNGIWNPLLSNNLNSYWIVELISWLILPTCMYLIGNNLGLFNNKEIGFHSNIFDKHYNVILLFIITAIVSPFLYLCYINFDRLALTVFPTNWGVVSFDYPNMIPEKGIGKLLVALYFALTAGFVEEFYYRGMLYKIINRGRESTVYYILISSIIFSSVHWEGGVRKLLATFLFGIVCASIYRFLKNLWPLAIGHTLTVYILYMR